jgi:hypothetical protein
VSLASIGQQRAQVDDPSAALALAPNKWSDQLVRLVPGDALAVFTAGVALCVGFNWGFWARLAVLLGVLLLTPGWIFQNYFTNLSPEKQRTRPLPIPWWGISIGLLALIAWSATVPGTPFLKWSFWDLKFAPAVTFVAAVLLSYADNLHTLYKLRHPRQWPTATDPA